MADDSADKTAPYVDPLENHNTKWKTTSDLNICTKWLRTDNEQRDPDEIPLIKCGDRTGRINVGSVSYHNNIKT